MIKYRFFSLFFLLGIAGGIARVMELGSYDAYTRLPLTDGSATGALVFSCIVFAAAVIAAAALGLTRKPSGDGNAGVPFIMPYIPAVLFAAAGIADIAGVVADGASFVRLLLALTEIAGAACAFLLISERKNVRTRGTGASVLVFTGCLWLLWVYAENSGNPIFATYWLGFAAALAAVLTFCALAGAHYGSFSKTMFFIVNSLAIYLLTASFIAYVCAMLLDTAQSGGANLAAVVRTGGALCVAALAPLLGHNALNDASGTEDDGPEESEEKEENA